MRRAWDTFLFQLGRVKGPHYRALPSPCQAWGTRILLLFSVTNRCNENSAGRARAPHLGFQLPMPMQSFA